MISLNDQPLTRHQLPPSSLLLLSGSALTRHASVNRNTSKVLAHTKRTHLQGDMFYVDGIEGSDVRCFRFHRTFSVKSVTSGHGAPRFGPWSRFLIAVWTLSPYLRGLPLDTPVSSHAPRHAAELLGLILLLPLTEVLASELELVPGRGAVIAHSS